MDQELRIFCAAEKAARDGKDGKAVDWFEEVRARSEGYFYIKGGRSKGIGTALHQAARDAALEAARCLLGAGARVDAVEIRYRCTPLHVAAWLGHADLVMALLAAGADAMARNEFHESCVDLAKGRALICFGCQGLVALIVRDGTEAVEALKAWKRGAQISNAKGERRSLDRAHLGDRLQVFLAPEESQGVLCAPEGYVNLELQNAFPRPQRRASLFYLPGLTAADACGMAKRSRFGRESHRNHRVGAWISASNRPSEGNEYLMLALKETSNEEVFGTDVVQAAVQAAWKQMQLSTAWEIFCCLTMVLFLCIKSFTFRYELPESSDAWLFGLKRWLLSHFLGALKPNPAHSPRVCALDDFESGAA